MQLDIEQISALLHIYEKSLAHPQLGNIRREAWNALLQIDEAHAAPPPSSTYVPSALDKELAGTPAAEPPPTAEPSIERRI